MISQVIPVSSSVSRSPLSRPRLTWDCTASALRHRKAVQDEAHKAAGDRWQRSNLVFTTAHGMPIEPRNVNRAYLRTPLGRSG
ncbi:hypothetical protein [Nonomuraea typhae]|uniref:Uncharacterized protein n=1 Tax=Nonomuraea typhae TaxID=2603600 RepID=A0ABW7ZA48_9ACTN